MRTKRTVWTIIAMTAAAVMVATSVLPVAAGPGYGRKGGGQGWNQDGGGCPGYGRGAGGGRGGGRWANLSEEQTEKATAEREAFLAATGELRRQIRQKDLELRSEIARETVDTEKAVGLQDELSQLKAQMAQKRLEHRLRMKEISPELAQGGRGFRGGRGAGGGGRCW